MSYSAMEKQENRIFLRPGLRPRLAFPALMFVSLTATVAAFVSFSGGLLPPHAFIFTGVACLLFFGGLLYRKGRSVRPKFLEFNNDAGDVLVHEYGSERPGVLPYGRIGSFLIRRKNRGRWTVFMIMKDGAYWDLAEFALRRAAAGFQGRLTRNIRLRTRDTLKPPPLPEHVQAEQTDSGTRIHWRENLSFQTFLTASGLLPGLLLIIAGLTMQARPDLLKAYWTWAVGAAVLLQLVFVLMAFRIRSSVHELTIHADKIAVKSGGEIARENVHRIQYSFDPDQGVPKLFFLNQEQAERLDRMRVGDVRLREIPRMFWMERKIFKVSLTGLRSSEAEVVRAHLTKMLAQPAANKKKR